MAGTWIFVGNEMDTGKRTGTTGRIRAAGQRREGSDGTR